MKRNIAAFFAFICVSIGCVFFESCANEKDYNLEMTLDEKKQKIRELEETYGNNIRLEILNYDSISPKNIIAFEEMLIKIFGEPKKRVMKRN